MKREGEPRHLMTAEEAQRLALDLADIDDLAERYLSPEEVRAYEDAMESVPKARDWAVRHLGHKPIGELSNYPEDNTSPEEGSQEALDELLALLAEDVPLEDVLPLDEVKSYKRCKESILSSVVWIRPVRG